MAFLIKNVDGTYTATGKGILKSDSERLSSAVSGWAGKLSTIHIFN